MKPQKPIRVYADTSVFGGVFDDEFAAASRTFFEQVEAGRFVLVTSILVRDEIAAGPEPVKEFFKNLLPLTETVEAGDSVAELRDAYLSVGIVPPRFSEDAMHVAYATVANCSAILSWNFRHIVHFNKVPLYNGVNEAKGYRSIAICSPREVIEYEDEDKGV